MRLIFLCLIFCLSIIRPAFAGQFGGDESNPFQGSFGEGPYQVTAGQVFPFTVVFEIPDQHYLYEESLQIEVRDPQNSIVGTLKKPSPEIKYDDFFGKNMAIYRDGVELELPITMPDTPWFGLKTVTGTFQFQGCSSKLCYRLMRVPFTVSFQWKEGMTKEGPTEPPPSRGSGNESWWKELVAFLHDPNFDELLSKGFFLAVFIAFLGGVLTDFTPCVWPLVPVTLTIIGVRKDQSAFKNFLAACVLVAGMAVMYSILGILSASMGKGLGFLFQNVFFLLLIEALLILMAFSLFGFFEIRLPAAFQLYLSGLTGAGYRGVFLVGLTMGFLAAPCVGPVVGPLLAFVAQTKSISAGFVLLFGYALGMGVLFLALAVFYGSVQKKIRSGPWMLWLKKGLGILLLGVAFFYGQVIYGHFATPKNLKQEYWLSSLTQGFEMASSPSKPMVVDFFAKWCPPCLELDHKVWNDPVVAQEIRERFVAVKIDCTQETTECREAVQRFQVVGWPTVVFLDSHQQEIKEKRLVGTVVLAGEMLEMLQGIK